MKELTRDEAVERLDNAEYTLGNIRDEVETLRNRARTLLAREQESSQPRNELKAVLRERIDRYTAELADLDRLSKAMKKRRDYNPFRYTSEWAIVNGYA